MRLRDEPQILAALADLDDEGLARFHESLLQDLADIGYWGASPGAVENYGHKVATQSIISNLRDLVPAPYQSTLPTRIITIGASPTNRTKDGQNGLTRVALQNWDNATTPSGIHPNHMAQLIVKILDGETEGFTVNSDGSEIHWEVVA